MFTKEDAKVNDRRQSKKGSSFKSYSSWRDVDVHENADQMQGITANSSPSFNHPARRTHMNIKNKTKSLIWRSGVWTGPLIRLMFSLPGWEQGGKKLSRSNKRSNQLRVQGLSQNRHTVRDLEGKTQGERTHTLLIHIF